MDFYLIDETGTRLHFPMNPDRITASTAARVQTFEAISFGEYALPRGAMLTRFKFDGLLPGESRKNTVVVKSWRDPQAIVGDLSGWRHSGSKLRLLVTETPFNHDVYIQNFEHTWLGGHGDAQYSLELVQAKDVLIYAEGEAADNEATVLSPSRPVPPTPSTYTVVNGDTLWGIAKKHLQDGARYSDIYSIPENKTVIGSDPNVIVAGQVLRLPV